MAETSMQMPGAFGGLMRYNEEYESKIPLKPIYVIAFVILIVAFRVGLAMFYG
ncbi:MAG: preprotein translocase subunit Sec61beta [Nanoarchaeota archaeon]|nr:preprotein translocase subunit Sec61beta [Nanoarchaeota archaeon]